MSNDQPSRALQPSAPENASTKIVLGNNAELDLSGLSDAERQALQKSHAADVLGVNKKALELGVDAMGLRSNLSTLADTTRQVAENGNSVTLKHEQTGLNTRTEVVMGNTPEAAKGKLNFASDSRTIYLIGGAVVVVVILALAFGVR